MTTNPVYFMNVLNCYLEKKTNLMEIRTNDFDICWKRRKHFVLTLALSIKEASWKKKDANRQTLTDYVPIMQEPDAINV